MTGPGDNILVSWAADLDDLEGQIEALQEAKRDLYATVREEHGKATAAALKTAVKLARMDGDKRQERDEIDAEAERILALIEARAPRATRVATAVPDQIEHHPAEPLPEVEADAVEGAADAPPLSTATHTALAADPSADAGPPLGNPALPASVEDTRTSIQKTMDELQSKKLNPATHFRNSQGLPRLHGCQEPDACAGTWRELCFTCRRVVEAA